MANEQSQSHIPAVVVGWVAAEPMAEVDLQAVRRARERTLEYLREAFPGFAWRMPLVRRKEVVQGRIVQPPDLIDLGVAERELGGWDFAMVVSEADLRAYFRPYCLGAPSQTMGVAALSTARLDPARADDAATDEERIQTLARRISALALHLFGHLNDAPHSEEPQGEDFMRDIRSVGDLDRMCLYADDQRQWLQEALEDVADPRLEEERNRPQSPFSFYLRALWHNRGDIFAALVEIRPWLFPYYFSRLTTAASSTLVILLVTAEAWELGMTQSPATVGVLFLLALLGASAFIIKRQSLLGRRRPRRLTEQRVITNATITLAVLTGMATMFLLLFTATYLLTQTLFERELVAAWAAALDGQVGQRHYVILAGFVACMGLVIGALGASFEGRGYFRHVAYVDEET